MALSYTTTNTMGFGDSQFATATNVTAIKSLVNQVVDRNYHKQVLKKSFFTVNGMVGPDTYNEGGVTESSAGYPVIRKTELMADSGDVVKMGQRRKLTSDHKTGGKVLNAQLVDNETYTDTYNLKVSIERWREAVRGFAGMNRKRNPFNASLEAMQEETLQDWSAEITDTATLYAQWCGWSPHLLRAHGTTNCPVTANPNTIFGNNESLSTSGTIADITGAGVDNVKGLTFELGFAYAEQNDFDLVSAGGGKYLVALISPKAALKLRRDAEFRDALLHARERGIENPLFKYATYVYNNCLIFTYDKIRSILGGNNPAGITVGSNEITEAAYTGIGGGVASTDLHQTIFLGANAVFYADSSMSIVGRKEDDYGNIIGSGIDMIFGARRGDWKSEDGNTTANQSSLVIVNTLVAAS